MINIAYFEQHATAQAAQMLPSPITDVQLVEAIAAAIAAMPVGASHEDRLRIAILEVRRSRLDLSNDEVLERAKILTGL